MSAEYMRRAIHSGDLSRALGGSGNDGSRRDIPGLIVDCEQAALHDCDVLTLHQVAYRLDLDTYTTQRVLDELHVPHGVYVPRDKLRAALVKASRGGA